MSFNSVRNRRSTRQLRDRRLRAASDFFRFSPSFLRLRLLPRWVHLSLAVNGCLLALLLLTMSRHVKLPSTSSASASTQSPQASATTPRSKPSTSLGPRHQLTYQQWVEQLAREATITAEQNPDHLTILAGDSISLWFPQDLLPSERIWLNQGISGETTTGLLNRLDLFDRTEPETIFVMIGINDLIRGVDDTVILDNSQEIIRYLQDVHPQAQIIVQSILPHAGEQATWEGRDRLLAVSNQRIEALNEELEALSQSEGVYFFDLYPLFATPEGNLRPELSTDGLHLSSEGYQVWAIALRVYSREVLEPEIASGE